MKKMLLAIAALAVVALLTACGDGEVKVIVVTATPGPSSETGSLDAMETGAETTAMSTPEATDDLTWQQMTTQTEEKIAASLKAANIEATRIECDSKPGHTGSEVRLLTHCNSFTDEDAMGILGVLFKDGRFGINSITAHSYDDGTALLKECMFTPSGQDCDTVRMDGVEAMFLVYGLKLEWENY